MRGSCVPLPVDRLAAAAGTGACFRNPDNGRRIPDYFLSAIAFHDDS